MTGAEALRGGCRKGDLLPAPGLTGDCPMEPWLLAGVNSPALTPALFTAKGSIRGTKGLIGRLGSEDEGYGLLVIDTDICSGSSTIAAVDSGGSQRLVSCAWERSCLPELHV